MLSTWCVVATLGDPFCMYAFSQTPYSRRLHEHDLLGGRFTRLYSSCAGLGLCRFQVRGDERRRRGAAAQAHGGESWDSSPAQEVALVLFALTPAPFNVIWLFCNGLPLGMVFGMVLGLLEGRRQTEALMAALCTSFIVADSLDQVGGRLPAGRGRDGVVDAVYRRPPFCPTLLLLVWMLTRSSRRRRGWTLPPTRCPRAHGQCGEGGGFPAVTLGA